MTFPTLPVIDLSRFKRPAIADAASPFRYPGGKGFLAGYLTHEVGQRFDSPPIFVEPFCGGAGAALHLLKKDEVSSIILNDADPRVYSAWRAMLDEPERFIDAVNSVPINIQSWNKYIEIVHSAQNGAYDFNLGFATFFINRTSRSGVILGSGPIGGYDQSGKWKIDARFNRTRLVEKIRQLAHLREHIVLTNCDALDFCRELSKLTPPDETFLFIDPPYIEAGGRLYLDAMNRAKHIMLSEWINSGPFKQWILTYDDHPLVRENYANQTAHHLSVNYSLAKKRLEKELVYVSHP